MVHQPLLQARDGFTFERQLNVDIAAVHRVATGMAHEGPPDVLQYAAFDQPGRERVPQVMKPDVPHAGAPERSFPCGFGRDDGVLLVREERAGVDAAGGEYVTDTTRERDFPSLAADGFRLGDGQHVPSKIDVLPALP